MDYPPDLAAREAEIAATMLGSPLDSDYCYDRDGQPIPFARYVALRGTRSDGLGDYCRVAADQIGDAWVSTVWLGIDHGYGFSSVPIIFETMVFGGKHNDYQDRYATEAEALAGHARAVAMVRRRRAWWRR